MTLKTIYNNQIYLLVILILSNLLISCQSQEQNVIKRTQFIMGTLVEISVYEKDKEVANKAIAKSFNEMSRLESIMSSYKPNSEISKFNISADIKRGIHVSTDLFKVIQRGIHWGKLSNGAIDISIGPAVKLWNFDSESPSLPDSNILINAIKFIDYRNVSTDSNRISLNKKGMSLHLGAIGKGYAVDCAVNILKNFGIKSGLINAGGDLMAFGLKGRIKPWRIGIQHPRHPEKIIASLDVKDKAVATSGDYQKYFMIGKKRYHHILNPKNGRPAANTMSATVMANTVTDADALSTALFILGAKKGIKFINSLEEVEGMILSSTGSIDFSSGFRSLPGFLLQDFEKNLPQ